MLRKIISLTTFFSFVLLILSSIMLYVVPEGRVAYWADWRIIFPRPSGAICTSPAGRSFW